MSPKVDKEINVKSNVAVVGSNAVATDTLDSIITQEKYVVKKGDTLNGIAYRFYGKYDESKILEIQRINNISTLGTLNEKNVSPKGLFLESWQIIKSNTFTYFNAVFVALY